MASVRISTRSKRRRVSSQTSSSKMMSGVFTVLAVIVLISGSTVALGIPHYFCSSKQASPSVPQCSLHMETRLNEYCPSSRNALDTACGLYGSANQICKDMKLHHQNTCSGLPEFAWVDQGIDLGEGEDSLELTRVDEGCTDKQPPSDWGKNTCELQKNAGNCENSWFRDHAEGYCEQTCGKCTADEWNVTDPTSCPTACGAAAGGGTPGTVACSTGTDSDCSTDDKPEATECPATANCGLEDLTAMTFKGGSKDEWLYVDATNAICISTTAESDPCSGRVAFTNADDTTLSFQLIQPVAADMTNRGTVDMTLTLTPKEGATGFAGQQDLKAYTMMNQDSGALHSAIASGQLKTAYTPVYATVKSAVDHVIEYRKKSHGDGNKNDFLQGKVTLAKVSLCVGVVYVYNNSVYNNSTEAIQGSDCAVKKSFEVTETKYSQLNATDGSVLYTANWTSRSDSSPWKTIALDHIAAQLV